MRWLSGMVACLCSAGVMTLASYTSADDMSPDLRRATDCMLGVLKTTPGVTDARLGMDNSGEGNRPFLEYVPSEKSRWTRPTHFALQKGDDPVHGPFSFMDIFPGLVGPGGLDTHVTNVVVERWKAECAVSASMLFE